MVYLEVVRAKGALPRPRKLPPERFLVIDGSPVRFIDEDGTLLGTRRFVWGKTLSVALRLVPRVVAAFLSAARGRLLRPAPVPG